MEAQSRVAQPFTIFQRHLKLCALQRWKLFRRAAMMSRLLVCVAILDQRALAERPTQECQSRRQRAVREPHRDCDGGKACLRREDLAVVSRRTLHVADFAWRIAP